MDMHKLSERYLKLAGEVATWSKDPSSQIGSVAIGEDNQVLSTGVNGFPRGVKDSPERFKNREIKYRFVSHSEKNLIYNACLNGVSLKNSTVYVKNLPVCSECAKGLIQVGVSKVVMQHNRDLTGKWEEEFQLTKEMFDEVGITYIRYDENGDLIE